MVSPVSKKMSSFHVDGEGLVQHVEPVFEDRVAVDGPARGLDVSPHLDGSPAVARGQASPEIGDDPRAHAVERKGRPAPDAWCRVDRRGVLFWRPRLERIDDLRLTSHRHRGDEDPDAGRVSHAI
jgi:hypothetical protein